MSTQVDPSKNLNSLLIGTAEFSFSAAATTVADTLLKGWLDFGNVKAFTPQVEVTRAEHIGSYRGVRRQDKTVATEAKLTYQLKCDEWNHDLLQILFGASLGSEFSQLIQSGVSGDALGFAGGTPSGTVKWYDLKVSGVRIRGITDVTIATLVEGTNFVVDKVQGRIRFLTDQTASRTPVITAPAIAADSTGSFKSLVPFTDIVKQGYGRLTVYDQDDDNKIVLDHQDFSCEVVLESPSEVNGTDFTEFTLNVLVTSVPGTIWARDALDNA